MATTVMGMFLRRRSCVKESRRISVVDCSPSLTDQSQVTPLRRDRPQSAAIGKFRRVSPGGDATVSRQTDEDPPSQPSRSSTDPAWNALVDGNVFKMDAVRDFKQGTGCVRCGGPKCNSLFCRNMTHDCDDWKPVAERRPVVVVDVSKPGKRYRIQVVEDQGLNAELCYAYNHNGTCRPPCDFIHACSLCLAGTHPSYICPTHRPDNVRMIVAEMEAATLPRPDPSPPTAPHGPPFLEPALFPIGAEKKGCGDEQWYKVTAVRRAPKKAARRYLGPNELGTRFRMDEQIQQFRSWPNEGDDDYPEEEPITAVAARDAHPLREDIIGEPEIGLHSTVLAPV